MQYQREYIPNEDIVFHRLNCKGNLDRRGDVIPNSFKQQGEGVERSLSCDWEKYSSPGELKARAKSPAENLIVQFEVGALRIRQFDVEHAPIADNRAHTDVRYEDGSKVAKTKHRAILHALHKVVLGAG